MGTMVARGRKREDSIGFPSLKQTVVLKIDLRPAAAAAAPGYWLKMQIIGPYSRPTASESMAPWPSMRPMHAKSENHYSKRIHAIPGSRKGQQVPLQAAYRSTTAVSV